MSVAFTPPNPMPALVARTEPRADASPCYLVVSPGGQPEWTSDPQRATAFASMREAARMALRLPSSLRAYGLPVTGEVTLH